MVLFQPADLMGLERKERRLEAGKKGGAVDEDRNRKKENDESRPAVIFRYGGGGATRVPLEKLKHARLPIISAPMKVKLPMNKGERISRMVEGLEGKVPPTLSQKTVFIARIFGFGTSRTTTRRTMFSNTSGSRQRRTTRIISRG